MPRKKPSNASTQPPIPPDDDSIESFTSSVASLLSRRLEDLGKTIQNEEVLISDASENMARQTSDSRRVQRALRAYSGNLLGLVASTSEEIDLIKRKVARHKSEIATTQSIIDAKKRMSAAYDRVIGNLRGRLNQSFQDVKRPMSILQGKRDLMARSGSITDKLMSQRQGIQTQVDTTIADKFAVDREREGIQTKILHKLTDIDSMSKRIDEIISQREAISADIAERKSELHEMKQYAKFVGDTHPKQRGYIFMQKEIIDELKKDKEDLRIEMKSLRDKLPVEQESLASIRAEDIDALTKIDDLDNALSNLNNELDKNGELLAKETFRRQRLTDGINELIGEIKEEMAKRGMLMDSMDENMNIQRKLNDAIQKDTDELEKMKDAVDITREKLHMVSNVVGGVLILFKGMQRALDELIKSIRRTQQTFGILAGQAVELKLDNIVSSLRSFTSALFTGSTPVGRAEIEQTQASFRGEFGGVLTSGSARDLAEQAKRLGVTADALARARRVFMTQSLGSVTTAVSQQNAFIEQFRARGLTFADAMEAVVGYTELMSRNGIRFQSSFAKAASDAKKIGVDLSKVDQIGDNIIGNFEGFLESQAELGAMGFGFDTSRLAELSESSDTGALFAELRSELSNTGKDITKLRRSEQLALSQAFGMSMEEFQRMAGITAGSGELTEEQKQTSALTTIVNRLEAIAAGPLKIIAGVIAGVHSYLLTAIAANTATVAGKSLFSPIHSMMNKMPSSGAMGSMVLRNTLMAGALGIGGSAMGALGDHLTNTGHKTMGGIASTLGSIGQFAAMGSLVGGPVGTAVGAVVGAIYGVVTNFDAWKDMIANAASLMKTVVGKLINVFVSVGKAMWSVSLPGIIISLFKNGIGGTISNIKSSFGMGDDVISKGGYGERVLLTENKAIALNNDDNVVAYADDLVSQSNQLTTLSKGAIVADRASQPSTKISVDMTRLEQKLDQVVRAISGMAINMDGNKVGKVIATNEERVALAGVYKAQRI